MYARGMSVRDIRGHLEEIYSVEVSPELISRVTDAVVDELRTWQSRPLDSVYLVIYLDALFIKRRDKGVVRNKAVYSVVGLGPDGQKDVLGLWIQNTEGATFWLSILTELRQRGVQDALIMCADGLTGLPDAIEAAFPVAIFRTCLVHMVRSSTAPARGAWSPASPPRSFRASATSFDPLAPPLQPNAVRHLDARARVGGRAGPLNLTDLELRRFTILRGHG
jgi:transposase-like protein